MILKAYYKLPDSFSGHDHASIIFGALGSSFAAAVNSSKHTFVYNIEDFGIVGVFSPPCFVNRTVSPSTDN